MALTRGKPTRELQSFRDAFNHFIDETWNTGWMKTPRRSETSIPLDIFEKDNTVFVEASLPGVKPENLDVQVRDDLLSITADFKDESEKKEGEYYMHEQRHGRLERAVFLPNPVLADRAEAIFENGILSLKLPKSVEASSKRIPIKGT